MARGVAGGLFASSIVLVVVVGARVLEMASGAPARGLVAGAVLLTGAFLGGALAALWSLRRDRPAVLVEEKVSDSRNVVLTAAELLDGAISADPYVARVVCRRAAELLEAVDLKRVVPARRPLIAVALAGAVSLGALGVALGASPEGPSPVPSLPGLFARAGAAAQDDARVEVLVRPPAYTGAEPALLEDPARIEALTGSRLEITVHTRAAGVVVETVEGRSELAAGPSGTFTGTVPVETDGFVSLEGRAAGQAGEGYVSFRRLMGLAVHPDLPPRVRIVEPGRDLILPDGDRNLEVVVEATDEFGLSSLEVVTTRATGFGELFTFAEGDIPFEITRHGPTRWTARAEWSLPELELERGDIVVYRAVARDRRPGAAPGESETYMVEIGGAEAALVGGFAGEDDMDRYALSQQMIIVLTERLMARRDSLSAEEFAREAQTLAAAQRRIRAEFVFMLGGELEDEHDPEEAADEALAQLHEEAHARADAAAAEGRLAHEGRIELTRAVQAMSHAAALLAAVEMDEALAAEETALIFLQRAFSASRYILRAMSEREQLDFSRRLTGALDAAVRDVRPPMDAALDPGVSSIRSALAEVASLAAAADLGASATNRVSELAGDVLRVDPASDALQRVAVRLGEAADASVADPAAARTLLGAATRDLAAWIRERLDTSPLPTTPLGVRRLDGALADALRDGPVQQGPLRDGSRP